MDYTDPVQHPITAGYGLEDLDRDLYNLSDLSVRRVKTLKSAVSPTGFFLSFLSGQPSAARTSVLLQANASATSLSTRRRQK